MRTRPLVQVGPKSPKVMKPLGCRVATRVLSDSVKVTEAKEDGTSEEKTQPGKARAWTACGVRIFKAGRCLGHYQQWKNGKQEKVQRQRAEAAAEEKRKADSEKGVVQGKVSV